jgi:hypothetical protein
MQASAQFGTNFELPRHLVCGNEVRKAASDPERSTQQSFDLANWNREADDSVLRSCQLGWPARPVTAIHKERT